MKAKKSAMRGVLALLVAGGLVACGGGGSDAPVPKPLALQGTAAVGLAVAGAQVRAKCLKGEGQASTAADGSYKLSVAGGELPCALELSQASTGLQLHSLAIPGGNGETANLTLLTEMVTTRLARRDAAAFFTGFDAAAGKNLSVDKLKLAQDEVAKLLAPTTTIRELSDFLGTPLKAATAAEPSAGDAQDRLLDALHSRLSKTRQAQLLGVLANAATPVDPGPFQPWLSVEPSAVSMVTGASLNLMADMNYPPNVAYVRQPVTWSVQEADGGSVVATSGAYTAPATPGTYHVRAVRDDFGSVSASVTVKVGPLQTLDQRNTSAITTAKNLVVKDQAAWLELWTQHLGQAAGSTPVPPPTVDFSKEMVLAVFLGSRPSGCHAVGISSVATLAGKLQVRYQELQAAAGTACTQAISAPAHLVKLTKSGLPAEFLLQP